MKFRQRPEPYASCSVLFSQHFFNLLTPNTYRRVDAILDELHATGRLGEINAFGNIQTGTSPLHIAIYKNRVNLVKKLISYPEIDLNFQTVDGRTPLFIAAEMNHLELVNALLAQATR